MSDATSVRWEKLPVIQEGLHSGCNHCGSKPAKISMARVLAVGFGSVSVFKDGVRVWSGDEAFEAEPKTIAEFETLAKADPDHDWRVHFETPLWDGTWQRQENEGWFLVHKGEGFA